MSRQKGRRGKTLDLLDGGTGAVIWEGPSAFDGAPLVVIATSIAMTGPPNFKTGPTIQTWIIRRDITPMDAVRQCKDDSICGDCRLRPLKPGNIATRPCYVNLAPVDRVWDAYKAGSYGTWPTREREQVFLSEDRVFRLGAYGDPAAVPHEVWEDLVYYSRGWVGYTHAWRTCPSRFKMLCMASVDSPEEREEARQGSWPWHTYRTRLPGEPALSGEILCPAAKEFVQVWSLGRRKRGLPPKLPTTCEKCQLCNGTPAYPENRRDIVVMVHGWGLNVSSYQSLRLAA